MNIAETSEVLKVGKLRKEAHHDKTVEEWRNVKKIQVDCEKEELMHFKDIDPSYARRRCEIK